MLRIKLTNNEIEYQFGQDLLAKEDRSFLQSFSYGQMQAKMGHEPVYMLVMDENDRIHGSFLAILFKAKRGRYFFLPYPVIIKDLWPILLDFLKTMGKKFRVDFIRFSPLADDDEVYRDLFAKAGFRNAPVHMMHPELLWLLDLSPDERGLLKGMRKNTRYALKQANKFDLKILSGVDEALLKKFYDVHVETSHRQHFVPYSWAYLKTQLEVFGPNDEIKVYLAEYDGRVIAGAVIMFTETEGVYHHGASLSEYNKIPGSYLIQWEAIKEAKLRGLLRYNFWGVVDNAPKHPWAGLSFFKKGFGGEGRSLLHCQDLPLTNKYWINYAVETFRRVKRGY